MIIERSIEVKDVFSDEELKYYDHPSEAWESKAKKNELVQAYATWICDLRDWSGFITLTFKNDTAPDVANRLLQRLISKLNEECFGANYETTIGHSYFSYVFGIELQKREVSHFHLIVDRPVNFQLIHRLWNKWGGYAWTALIRDKEKTVMYISKYIGRGGEVLPYLADKKYVPLEKPYWWVEKEDYQGLIDQS